MTRTVDVVIVGGGAAAVAATIDAVRLGQRVLVVIRARRSGFARQLREALGTAMVVSPARITVLTGAEVACVDGVQSIEAVVVRQRRTRRLIGFNASALLVVGRSSE
jgi:pyruvate/2-oxoglutarate dehydrogenase complex dihydrolipoamide dehydrogenase (E3) component